MSDQLAPLEIHCLGLTPDLSAESLEVLHFFGNVKLQAHRRFLLREQFRTPKGYIPPFEVRQPVSHDAAILLVKL